MPRKRKVCGSEPLPTQKKIFGPQKRQLEREQLQKDNDSSAAPSDSEQKKKWDSIPIRPLETVFETQEDEDGQSEVRPSRLRRNGKGLALGKYLAVRRLEIVDSDFNGRHEVSRDKREHRVKMAKKVAKKRTKICVLKPTELIEFKETLIRAVNEDEDEFANETFKQREKHQKEMQKLRDVNVKSPSVVKKANIRKMRSNPDESVKFEPGESVSFNIKLPTLTEAEFEKECEEAEAELGSLALDAGKSENVKVKSRSSRRESTLVPMTVRRSYRNMNEKGDEFGSAFQEENVLMPNKKQK